MTQQSEEEYENRSGLRALIAVARDHPFLAGTLGVMMGIGSIAAWSLMPEEISSLRRVLGGALLGLVSWLLVMMGRLLD